VLNTESCIKHVHLVFEQVYSSTVVHNEVYTQTTRDTQHTLSTDVSNIKLSLTMTSRHPLCEKLASNMTVMSNLTTL